MNYDYKTGVPHKSISVKRSTSKCFILVV